jgi:Glycosyl transferase family 2
MPSITILIPTFNHADTLTVSIDSVLAQTIEDYEVFVIGDGVPERTREIMAEFCQRDSRIRFFDNPKGLRHGEQYRHAALQQASGRLVCYLCDDDLWLPHHLEVLTALLETADFAHTLHVSVHPDGNITSRAGDLNDAPTRKRMLNQKWNFFGPTVTGHTLGAYRRLPEGWRPAPAEMWSDLYMWRQFLTQPNMVFLSDSTITALHFASPQRPNQNPEQRAAELRDWWNWRQEPNALITLNTSLLTNWNAEITQFRNQQEAISQQCQAEQTTLQAINQALFQGLRWQEEKAVLLGGPPSPNYGHIDVFTLKTDSLYISGWAYDVTAQRPFVCICIFAGAVLLRVVQPSICRLDVAKHLGILAVLTGFECTLPPVDSVSVVALSHTGQFFPIVSN